VVATERVEAERYAEPAIAARPAAKKKSRKKAKPAAAKKGKKSKEFLTSARGPAKKVKTLSSAKK
jgi:hypothetical protein